MTLSIDVSVTSRVLAQRLQWLTEVRALLIRRSLVALGVAYMESDL